MDKRLFSAALFLLILEITWLCADMNLIYIRGLSKEKSEVKRVQIGSVEERRHSLKRKYLDSIIWEETSAQDPLYFLDSVLTLDQSSATLRLMGDTQLKLSENTLVVLEPSEDSATDQLRVRFSRGDLTSRNPNQGVEVDVATWTVEVQKGSEINLRTKDSEHLELEVRKGSVKVKEDSQMESANFESGSVVKMHKTELTQNRLDRSLQWVTPFPDLTLVRKYSHDFPVLVTLEWKGDAHEMSWDDPKGITKVFPIASGTQKIDIFLEKGLHHFRLMSGARASSALPVEVWRAPEIHSFWPLPRERIVSSSKVPFSWSSSEAIAIYDLRIEEKNKVVLSKSAGVENQIEDTISLEGNFEWCVEGRDSLGFAIPHYYKSPIYFLRNPLAPPILETPELLEQEIRKPAEKNSSSMNILKEIFWSQAHAQEKYYKALFRWRPVELATGYTIEVDDEPNFKTPLIQQKVSTPEFTWENFKLGNYYWRVAAEGENGQMGLFSPVTSVDLTNPKVFQPIEEAKTEKVNESPPHEKSAKRITAKPIKKPEKPPAVATPPPSLEEEEPPPVALPAEAPPLPARGISGYFVWTPGYLLSQGAGNSNFKTSFSGVIPFAVESRLDFPVDQKSNDISIKISYRQIDYRPKPEADYPFQDKLKRNQIRSSLYYGNPKALQWGIRTLTYQSITRKSFEQISAEDRLAYGPSVLLPLSPNFEFEPTLLYGTQAWMIDTQIRYRNDVLFGSEFGLLYGAEIGMQYLKGTDYHEYEIFPKLFFGLKW